MTVTGCLQERDKLQNETISAGDMKDVFRMYGVSVQIPAVHTSSHLTLHWLIMPQLELTKTQIKKISNEDGFIAKADFIKCAQVLPLSSSPVPLRPLTVVCRT